MRMEQDKLAFFTLLSVSAHIQMCLGIFRYKPINQPLIFLLIALKIVRQRAQKKGQFSTWQSTHNLQGNQQETSRAGLDLQEFYESPISISHSPLLVLVLVVPTCNHRYSKGEGLEMRAAHMIISNDFVSVVSRPFCSLDVRQRSNLILTAGNSIQSLLPALVGLSVVQASSIKDQSLSTDSPEAAAINFNP